jgi:hypothetical protein
MWKLLPVCLLVSCAVNDQQQPAGGGDQPEQFRIVRQVELPVESSAEIINGQSARKTFHRQGVQGWLDETGAWRIEGEVHHGRLRCATYETGIQLGRGNPACADVEWLTGVEYATRVRHCNSASRVHAGGGEFSDMANRFNEVSCVRVLVRCEGAC